jgi:hypothetical protein
MRHSDVLAADFSQIQRRRNELLGFAIIGFTRKNQFVFFAEIPYP